VSSSFSTTPAREKSSTGRPPAASRREGGTRGSPGRGRTALTWFLLAVWAVLIAFGLVSMTDPQWLDKYAQAGKEGEASAYKHYGDAELKKGNYRVAIAQYKRSLEIRSDQADVLVNLGITYLKSGDLSRGEEALQKAKRMEVTPIVGRSLHYYLAELNEKHGRSDEAIRNLEDALAAGIRPDVAYRKLGTIYLARDDYLRAQEFFENALAGQQDLAEPYLGLLRRCEEGAAEDAETRAWLASEQSRTISESDLSRYDLESIRQMHARDPELAKTHNHLGLISYKLRDLDGAIEHFERSASIWPGNVDATRNLQTLKAIRLRGGS